MAGVTSLLSSVKEMYSQTMEFRDKRVDDWFMMDSPLPTVIIVVCYVYLVKFAGPKFMKDREPFEFRRLLLVYNITMVLFSFYLFYELLALGWGDEYKLRCQPVDYSTSLKAIRGLQVWGRDYSLRCQPVDYSNSPKALKMARACYWYYISKFIELSDTVFFVLRKKQNQVSTLHVVHHGIMPLSVWTGVRFTPGGHGTFFGLLNTFVHVFMYAYYTIAALGPKYQKFLWWKRYLTALQIFQFVLVLIHALQLLFVECNYPKAFVYMIGGHSFMFIILFSDFYMQAYGKKRAAAAFSKKHNGYHNGISNTGQKEIKNGHTKKLQ